MKIRSFLLLLLLFSVVVSYAQNNALVGTWKLVSGKMTNADSTVTYGGTGEAIKIITPTHFSVMSKDATGNTGHFAGGRVKMDASNYTEMLDYSSEKSMLNNNVVFTYKIEGNKCSVKGGTDAIKFDEVWEKIE